MAPIGATNNIEDLKSRYQMQNSFGNNLRVNGGTPVEKAGGPSEVGYTGGYDFIVPNYAAPNIDGGTRGINGLYDKNGNRGVSGEVFDSYNLRW